MTSAFVPFPGIDDPGFPASLQNKREFELTSHKSNCDGTDSFKLQAVQQFVSTYMSPITPYQSILLMHGTGVGKTCAAIQIAELQHGGTGRALVLVPSSVQGGFESNVYNTSKIDKTAYESSKYQCTGSTYYSKDIESMSALSRRKHQRTKIRKRYEFTGHDKFSNRIVGLISRINREFNGVSEEGIEREIDETIKAVYDNRVIIVDEVHSLRSSGGKTKTSYDSLLRVLKACSNCRLVLLSATPMYNRSTEIIDIINLMRANENLELLDTKGLFEKNDRLTAKGKKEIREALKGRVSYMTFEDPDAFPIHLTPSMAGVESKYYPAPTHTMDGKPIPRDERLDPADMELYYSNLGSEQLKSYNISESTRIGGLMICQQMDNVCYDGERRLKSEEMFAVAFKKVRGASGHVFNYVDKRYLHPDNIDRYAPKIGAMSRLVKSAKGLCFVYSSFKWSGVYAGAIALEELGFIPFKGRPMLDDAPGRNSATAPRYVIITKDDEAGDVMSITEKVEAANDPINRIKVVLGTETAAQGLDFKMIREVHVLEPWWNLSLIRQVVGRGIRRCSHAALVKEERNTTVFMHCTRKEGKEETLDQMMYRYAINKNIAISEVERIIMRSAIDCGMYETKDSGKTETHRTSQDKIVKVSRTPGVSPTTCDVKWNLPKNDASTYHPYVYKTMVDLLAWDVKSILTNRRAATFDELKNELNTDEILLSMTLTVMMNPLTSWRWIEGYSVVYRGGLYVMVPYAIENDHFTLAEAKIGVLFSSDMRTRLI